MHMQNNNNINAKQCPVICFLMILQFGLDIIIHITIIIQTWYLVYSYIVLMFIISNLLMDENMIFCMILNYLLIYIAKEIAKCFRHYLKGAPFNVKDPA